MFPNRLVGQLTQPSVCVQGPPIRSGPAATRVDRTTRTCAWFLAVIVMLGLVCARSAAAQEVTARGAIVGTVTESDTGLPVTRAQVSVEVGGFSRTAHADEQGLFQLRDVPPGAYLVLVMGPGYAPSLQPDVIVTPGRHTQITAALERAPAFSEDIVVQASAFSRPADVATGVHTLSFEEIRRAPGGLGDVSRLMLSLPGVVTSSDQRNDIVARGGSPSENLTMVDGIEVPNINHFAAQGTSGGPVGMLNNELIQNATFLAGGFPAAYGDRLPAVLDVTLRDGSRDALEADIDLGRETTVSARYDLTYRADRLGTGEGWCSRTPTGRHASDGAADRHRHPLLGSPDSRGCRGHRHRRRHGPRLCLRADNRRGVATARGHLRWTARSFRLHRRHHARAAARARGPCAPRG